jgi:hypothetical protein
LTKLNEGIFVKNTDTNIMGNFTLLCFHYFHANINLTFPAKAIEVSFTICPITTYNLHSVRKFESEDNREYFLSTTYIIR